jgi:hypothetical protein
MRRHLQCITCALLITVTVRTAAAQTWDLARPVSAGDTRITGFVPVGTGPVTIEISAPNEVAGGVRRVVSRHVVTPDKTTGTISADVTAVRVGHRVHLIEANIERDVTEVPPLQPPVVHGPVRAGTRAIEGTADAKNVLVIVRTALRLENGGGIYLQQAEATVANGKFQLVLPQPVLGGQRLEVLTFTGRDRSPSTELIITDPGDWGRLRAYFAGGVVMSKEHGEFSQQDIAVSLVLDKTWFQRQTMTLPPDDDRITRADLSASVQGGAGGGAPERSMQTGETPAVSHASRWRALVPRQLNTFFDTRVTALPVLEAGGQDESQAGGSDSGQNATEADKFIASRKGAVMQIGVYTPWYGGKTSWVHEGRVNALFIAPVARIGIQTVTEEPAASDNETAGANQTLERDDVFQFWSIGVGVGHYRLTGTRNEAPELISYLHITFGKSQAFGEVPEGETEATMARRWFIEGRLKIPDTALQIGFDANLGEGRDDLRFIFGTRFDLGAVIARMRQFN